MRNLFTAIFLLLAVTVSAQKKQEPSIVIAGPMIGHVDLRTATIWVQLENNFTRAQLFWEEKGGKNLSRPSANFVFSEGPFKTATAVMTDLKPGTTYKYTITVNMLKPRTISTGEVTTQQLWQWRKQAPDFSFITGSCAYFNQPEYDRPGKPYGGDSSIFETMAKEKAEFMLWLGDNWYTREADYYSEWGLNYRATRDRSLPVLQPFLKAMPHYAIWDDHDYGWNDADKSYPLKKESREVFKKIWCNPSYGENGEAVYTKMTWNDVDIFMLDDPMTVCGIVLMANQIQQKKCLEHNRWNG
jgi:alkaline phosphatase D